MHLPAMAAASLILLLCFYQSETIADTEKPTEKEVAVRYTRCGGQEVAYQVTLESFAIAAQGMRPAVDIHAWRYSRTPNDTDLSDPTRRATLFAWSGGPGASAMTLHMGLLGPKRINLQNCPDTGDPLAASLEDNPECLLDLMDIVLIDPPGTGYSGSTDKDNLQYYFNSDRDAKVLADTISQYVKRYNLWRQPRFVLGESYGAARAVKVTRELIQQGLPVSGMILLAPHLFYSCTDNIDALCCNWNLQSYAVTARYHGLSAEKNLNLDHFLNTLKSFSDSTYLPAMINGHHSHHQYPDNLPQSLVRYTGMTEQDFQVYGYCPSPTDFIESTLRNAQIIPALKDSRFHIPFEAYTGARTLINPIILINQTYIPLFNEYLYTELKPEKEQPYVSFNPKILGDWQQLTGDTMNAVIDDMTTSMMAQRQLRILALAGLYDLQIPFRAIEYVLSRPGIDPSRVDLRFLPSGHGPYVDEDGLVTVSQAIRSMVTKTLSDH
ncbi:S10 family serine carboxypeptidase-like protein [Kistimonas asteriae]|uniref:S10 family serine carboxypeptidase-like protein n=1 Tax=Kistimonas asteriae TaxID=517724 RepID=UPI001BA43F59|nr:hypothetical protein [Kistimonas asteriae]